MLNKGGACEYRPIRYALTVQECRRYRNARGMVEQADKRMYEAHASTSLVQGICFISGCLLIIVRVVQVIQVINRRSVEMSPLVRR